MRYCLLFCCAALAFGQGTDTKKKAEDYEVHAQAKSAAIGAEYMVHSFSRGEQSFIAQDYLVVEVALFPPKDTNITARNGLRINGKKQGLLPQAPQMVAAAMQHPEWDDRTRPSVDLGAGPVRVTIGVVPTNRPPIPGSNPPGTQPPSRVPVPRDNPTGMTKEPVRADALVLETALVEGEHHAAFSGFLYFPWRGKTSSIKTLELLYEDTVLKLK